MTKVILFDLDGTLADTALDFFSILEQGLKQARVTRNEPFDYQELRRIAGCGADAMICYSYQINSADPLFVYYKKQFLAEYARLAGTYAALFPGILELLNGLEQQQIPWAIVTDKPRGFTLKLLMRWQLKPAAIVCSDDLEVGAQCRKPHPKSLHIAYKQIKCPTKAAGIYVGDSIKDIQAGKAAGMETLAVGYGYTPYQALVESTHKATYTASSVSDLARYLMQWIKATHN